MKTATTAILGTLLRVGSSFLVLLGIGFGAVYFATQALIPYL